MKKIKKGYYYIFLIIIFFYSLGHLFIGSDKLLFFKDKLTINQKNFIKKYIFPYKYINQLESININLNEELEIYRKNIPDFENYLNKINYDIKTKKIFDKKIEKNFTLTKYKLLNGFYLGINNLFPGSGYIDFHLNKLIVLSAGGKLVYSDNNLETDFSFKHIKNNISDFIDLDQYKKFRGVSIKDLHIYNNSIHISFTDEIEKDCWNTSIISGKMNFSNIKFKKIFSAKKCLKTFSEKEGKLVFIQSGGRIISINEQNILLTVGDYRRFSLAQDEESINGKIVKINLESLNYEILSMGHRNIQGIYYDKDNEFIIATEHGPYGGDEINLISTENESNKIQNYGWPTSSYGEMYGAILKAYPDLSKKFPLHKSHKKYGFVEPIKFYNPSIGPSEIVKIGQNKYVFGTMKKKSIIFFELNQNNELVNERVIKVGERIRDLRFKDGKIYMFLEDTASIGVLNF